MTLAELDRHIWATMQRAAIQRRHDWSTPALITIAADEPQARTVVLRHVDPFVRQLTLFTDVRSSKVSEIQANPRVAWLFWDHASKTQLRVAAIARLAPEGVKHEALNTLTRQQLRDYTSQSSPGQRWTPDNDHRDESLVRRTFAVIETEVHQIDWLKIDRETNLRALFDYTGAVPEAQWLVP